MTCIMHASCKVTCVPMFLPLGAMRWSVIVTFAGRMHCMYSVIFSMTNSVITNIRSVFLLNYQLPTICPPAKRHSNDVSLVGR